MHCPVELSGEAVFASVSIGIVVCSSDGISTSDLVRRGDLSLYEAKERGRQRFSVYQHGLDELMLRRQAIEQDLRVAISSNNQITMAYQPVFDARGIHAVGAEALMLWHHPVHGSLSPSIFIGIAEERGLIDALGKTALDLAALGCHELQGYLLARPMPEREFSEWTTAQAQGVAAQA